MGDLDILLRQYFFQLSLVVRRVNRKGRMILFGRASRSAFGFVESITAAVSEISGADVGNACERGIYI
jgi:hypothetical protein